MYLDEFGLITQRDGDGGDKLQRTGFWFETGAPPISERMASYSAALFHLTDSDGNLLRDEIKYTDPKDVSRDQLIPNIRAFGLFRFYRALDRVLENLLRNFSRYPNGDLAFLTDYAAIIRSYCDRRLYAALWFLDVQLFLTSIWTVIRSYFDTADLYVGEDLNHIGCLLQAKRVMPTVWSWLACKTFKLRRGGPMYGMRVYFRPETGANPEFITLWGPLVEEF